MRHEPLSMKGRINDMLRPRYYLCQRETAHSDAGQDDGQGKHRPCNVL